MSLLDRKAVQATIMDALVYKGLINPKKESLDIEHLCIRENLEYYVYEPYPDVCGIPLWMKEKYRTICLKISGGIPVSIYLARPTMNKNSVGTYCIYDLNTAISSIFPETTFYNVFYTSPTRGVKIEEQRPFVEVDLGERNFYLVDALTKRIFKSSYFKENYGFEIKSMDRKTEYQGVKKEIYLEHTTDQLQLGSMLYFLQMLADATKGRNNEFLYELEKSKENYPEEWEQFRLERSYFRRTP